jgi:penicillin-binding protein 1B
MLWGKVCKLLGQRPMRTVLTVTLTLVVFFLGVGIFSYVRLARLIDRKLRIGPFMQSVNIYAAPVKLRVGDAAAAEEIAAQLGKSGYTTAPRNLTGRYTLSRGALEIYPGLESYFGPEPAVLHFSGGKLERIVSLADNTERTEYLLEPRLMINLTDRNREKRRMVHFADIPPHLMHAVMAVEDKHFFQHSGFDLPRILKAAWVDLREGRKEQGASTLSMQLARNLWLEPDKNFRRKVAEILMTVHLENKLSKQQIFEIYCNQIYLGRRGTFSINGFGEAARDLFGKDIGQLTLAESALLAGMIQRPSFYNPTHNPDRALERRNLVLSLMREQGYITEDDRARAAEAKLHLSATGDTDSLEAQYFIDLVNNDVQSRLEKGADASERVYTTLDLNLQHAAEDAVRAGLQEVDQQLGARRKKERLPPHEPQVALLALDPHTGQIKALVGGRSYGQSQLNHVLAERQPGSSFKPFVYAAALDTAVEGGSTILTPASGIDDQPTTFRFGNETYTPANFHEQFFGRVSLRTALAHSLNVATVKVAQTVGLDNVVQIARRAGLPHTIRATPAVALGAYETTPLDIAGAYTVFANEGVYVRPSLVESVRGRQGRVLFAEHPEVHRALDPRVAYLMVNLLQEVMRSGTAAGVRGRGFYAPAAGKTGTSRDGWFAGFTSELLCVVWVGFDDNRDLGLEGSRSALPIWTEFMKRAIRFPDYANAKPFAVPDGVVSAELCNDSGRLATTYCESTHREVFVDGTQPAATCPIHGPVPAEVVVFGQQTLSNQGNADRVLTPMTSDPGERPQPHN